jgi:hypothetical protein
MNNYREPVHKTFVGRGRTQVEAFDDADGQQRKYEQESKRKCRVLRSTVSSTGSSTISYRRVLSDICH